jgi:hypothetical protein
MKAVAQVGPDCERIGWGACEYDFLAQMAPNVDYCGKSTT